MRRLLALATSGMPLASPPLAITPPTHPLIGRVTPPGSKSITNRALLLSLETRTNN